MTHSTPSVVIYGKLYYSVARKLNQKGIAEAGRGSGSIENYDLIIIYPGAFESIKDESNRKEELLIRTKDIRNALKRGSHVCILISDINDPLIEEIYFLHSLKYIKGVKGVQEINTKRSEFDTFIRNNGIAFGFFPYRDSMSVICTVRNMYIDEKEDPSNIFPFHNEFVVGFSSRIGKGLLTVLPFYTSDSGSSKSFDQVMLQLVDSLDTHKKNIIFEPP